MKLIDVKLSDVQEFLEYAPHYPSGLMWKIDKYGGAGKGQKKGLMAGSMCKAKGYWHVTLNGKSYRCQRVICVLHGLDIENQLIDHIDGNPSNNTIENLRTADYKKNGRNKRMPITNTTGFLGLSRRTHKGITYWEAHWKENGNAKTKGFSVGRHGEWGAFAKACEARKAGIKAAELDGVKYTARHLNSFTCNKAEAALAKHGN